MPYTDKLTALSNSIKAKNPSYTGTLSLAKMKEAVDNISSGVDTSVITATAADCLNTKKILLADGSLVSGSIATNSAVSKTLTTSSTSYTIPSGYHNGSGKISISTQTKTVTPSTSSQSITADSGKVLTGVTVGAKSGRSLYYGTVKGTGGTSLTIPVGVSFTPSSCYFTLFAGHTTSDGYYTIPSEYIYDYTNGTGHKFPLLSANNITNGGATLHCTPEGFFTDSEANDGGYYGQAHTATLSRSGTNAIINSAIICYDETSDEDGNPVDIPCYHYFPTSLQYAWFLLV